MPGRNQVFDSEGGFLAEWGVFGTDPGQLEEPGGIAVSEDGRVYITDSYNSRIQVIRPYLGKRPNKAVIIASEGGVPTGELSVATTMCANLAYRAMLHQGFARESIRYYSPDVTLDLDNNGVEDDIAGVPTKENVENAITNWAQGADNLLVYLVDAGTRAGLKVNNEESITGDDLASWFDAVEGSLAGNIVLVYDASNSGSVLQTSSRKSTRNRVIIASTLKDEEAQFLSDGLLSFSSHFWIGMFSGMNLYDAFGNAKAAMGDRVAYQHPVLDDDGDGIGNGAQDGALARNIDLVNETDVHEEVPVIAEVSPVQTIESTESKADLYAEGVVDDRNGIARVWAVVSPAADAQSQKMAASFALSDLRPAGDDKYEGSYSGFKDIGKYNVDIYALDGNLNISQVQRTAVHKAAAPGSLAGRVTDAVSGDVIEGATVRIESMTETTTDRMGEYLFLDVPSGAYTVTVTADGYSEQTESTVVSAGELVELSFELGDSDESPPKSCGMAIQSGGLGVSSFGDACVLVVALSITLVRRNTRSRSKARR